MMKILFVLLTLLNFSYAGYNISQITTNGKNILSVNDVSISNFNSSTSASDVFSKTNAGSDSYNISIKMLTYSNENVPYTSEWDFDSLERSKDSLTFIYLAYSSGSAASLRRIAICENFTNDLLYADDNSSSLLYQYAYFDKHVDNHVYADAFDDSKRIACHFFRTQLIASLDNTSSFSFEDILTALAPDLKDDGLLSDFETQCNSELDCNYKYSFDKDSCISSFPDDFLTNNYTSKTLVDFIKTDEQYVESPAACEPFAALDYTVDDIVYDVKGVLAAKNEDSTCYRCLIQTTTLFLKARNLCDLERVKAVQVCYLENKYVSNYVCNVVNGNETEGDYDCLTQAEKYSHLDDEDTEFTYDEENKYLTDGMGNVYSVDDQGRILNEDGQQTGYHMYKDENGNWKIQKTSDAQEAVRDVDEAIDDTAEEVVDALRDCPDGEWDSVLEKCNVAEVDTVESLIVKVVYDTYEVLSDEFSSVKFLDSLDYYKLSEYESIDWEFDIILFEGGRHESNLNLFSKESLDKYLSEYISTFRTVLSLLAVFLAFKLVYLRGDK